MADARDDELRARYRALATEEPSAALDDAIRAAARRAVASGPGGARRSFTQRWAVPASLAAVLFLSFGVVMHMQQETPSVESELRGAPPAAPPPAAKPEARMAEPQSQPSKPQPSQSPPPKLTRDIERDKPSEVAIAPMPRKEKKVLDAAVAPGSAPAPAAAPAPRAAPPVAEPPSAPLMKQEALKESVPSAQESAKRDAAPARAASAPDPRPFSDSAAPPRAAFEERNVAPSRREDETSAATGGLAASRAKTESFAAKPVEPAPSVAPATPAAPATGSLALRAQGRAAASGTDRLEPWPDTPEKKLERIESLRKAGRDRDADEAIARFKREHPDYVIPEDVWIRIKPR